MNAARLIPWVVHEAVEYGAVVLLLLAPWLFDFESTAARWASVAIGVAVLVIALLSRGRLGATKVLSSSAHATLDYVVAAVLVLSPFVLGFADDTSAVTFFVLLGVAHLALTLLTRFPTRDPADAEAP